MKLFCYLAIITWSNIAKIAFELARYFTNLSSNHVKTANHCIIYLHATKYLAIRYSNLENEKLSNQISNSNKKTTLSFSKKWNRRIRNWIELRHRTKNRSRFLREQRMHFLQMIWIEKALRIIFSNFSMIWSIELQKNNSQYQSSSLKRNFFRCCMQTRNWFDEYISFRN